MVFNLKNTDIVKDSLGNNIKRILNHRQEILWELNSNLGYLGEYLTIEALEDNCEVYWCNNLNTSPISIEPHTIFYWINGYSNWHSVQSSSVDSEGVGGHYLAVLNKGEKVLLAGPEKSYGTKIDGSPYMSYFRVTKNFNVYGNIMSMVNMKSTDIVNNNKTFIENNTLTDSWTFLDLFYHCDKLISAENLILPATVLSTGCYAAMFTGCSSLIKAPELPAENLVNTCYSQMFWECSSLTEAPVLPAKTLKPYCYRWMFERCPSLNYIKCLATNISAIDCLTNWVYNVGSTGTFIKDINTNWPSGASGIPSGWTVQNI